MTPPRIVVTFGTTVPGEVCAVLKLLLAAHVAKVAVEVSEDVSLVPGGRAPALLVDTGASTVVLFDANAAVCHLLSDKSGALGTHWLAWEQRQTSHDVHVTADGIAKTLAQLNAHLQTSSTFPSAAVEVALYALVFALRHHRDVNLKMAAASTLASATPALDAWFDAKSKVDAYRAAVAQWRKLTDASHAVRIAPGVEVPARPAPANHVPLPGKRNILITSALPYVNNVPHLGNIIGCVLSADVFARFCRLRGYNTLYVCGTDEYGTATETKAMSEGITCQELCDRFHVLHAEIYSWFDIAFDHFGRTTTPAHTKISQDIFHTLNGKGRFLTDSLEQLYCEQCQRFLADRYVEGICPLCKYPDARGDQCDGCQKLLNSADLIEPRCKADGTRPIIRSSEHMFLDLPALQPQLEQWVKRASDEGFWSSNGKTITNGWLKEGLKKRCITRDLKWGTPVPLEAMKGKVLYVWFDAPIGYLSITANYTSEWQRWWKNPQQVKLYQFMGKDNVPFHTVIFPASLLGTEEDYTLLHHLSTTEYLNYEGAKFSKSRGVGVFGNNVMDSQIPAAVWRYYLLANRPESNDSMFTWNELAMRNNTELLANLGNFINRTLKFLKAKYNSVVPSFEMDAAKDGPVVKAVNELLQQYIEALEAVKIRHGLQLVMMISAAGNQYLQDNKLDNTLYEKQQPRCRTVMAMSVNLIYLLAALIEPYMPSTSASIYEQLNAPRRTIPDKFEMVVHAGHRLGTPALLFTRIEEKRVQELIAMYGGGESAAATVEEEKSKPKRKPATGGAN